MDKHVTKRGMQDKQILTIIISLRRHSPRRLVRISIAAIPPQLPLALAHLTLLQILTSLADKSSPYYY